MALEDARDFDSYHQALRQHLQEPHKKDINDPGFGQWPAYRIYRQDINDLREQLRGLEQLGVPKRTVFDAYLDLLEGAMQSVIYRPLLIAPMNVAPLFEALDDFLVESAVHLLSQDPEGLADAYQIAERIRQPRQVRMPSTWPRIAGFLRPLCRRNTAHLVAERALQRSDLPSEIVAVVADHAAGFAGWQAFLRPWRVPRPLHARRCPRSEQADDPRGCLQWTCPSRTFARWNWEHFCWDVHHAQPETRLQRSYHAVICHSKQCEGHHDMELGAESYTLHHTPFTWFIYLEGMV